jgi:hypothetical protein
MTSEVKQQQKAYHMGRLPRIPRYRPTSCGGKIDHIFLGISIS